MHPVSALSHYLADSQTEINYLMRNMSENTPDVPLRFQKYFSDFGLNSAAENGWLERESIVVRRRINFWQ